MPNIITIISEQSNDKSFRKPRNETTYSNETQISNQPQTVKDTNSEREKLNNCQKQPKDRTLAQPVMKAAYANKTQDSNNLKQLIYTKQSKRQLPQTIKGSILQQDPEMKTTFTKTHDLNNLTRLKKYKAVAENG